MPVALVSAPSYLPCIMFSSRTLSSVSACSRRVVLAVELFIKAYHLQYTPIYLSTIYSGRKSSEDIFFFFWPFSSRQSTPAVVGVYWRIVRKAGLADTSLREIDESRTRQGRNKWSRPASQGARQRQKQQCYWLTTTRPRVKQG